MRYQDRRVLVLDHGSDRTYNKETEPILGAFPGGLTGDRIRLEDPLFEVQRLSYPLGGTEIRFIRALVMRLITWNCHHGGRVERAAELEYLGPNIVVLQECKKPESLDGERLQWFGENPGKGVCVLASGDFTLERGPVEKSLTHSVFPVRVNGPTSFNLLAVHAWRRPTYVEAVDHGITTYSQFLTSGISLIAGDFNSHWSFIGRTPS